jgi:hypothetical protein
MSLKRSQAITLAILGTVYTVFRCFVEDRKQMDQLGRKAKQPSFAIFGMIHVLKVMALCFPFLMAQDCPKYSQCKRRKVLVLGSLKAVG